MEAMKNDLSGSGNGDAPNSETAGEPSPEIGKYGMRAGRIDGAPEGTYTTLLTENRRRNTSRGSTGQHGIEVRLMTGQMAGARVNEQMKAENPIRWTQEMNSIKASAEEIVRHQLIEA